jgi:hypothetical protein
MFDFNSFYRVRFRNDVLPIIEKYDTCDWMWRCSSFRKRITLERGAIQQGRDVTLFSDYDNHLIKVG